MSEELKNSIRDAIESGIISPSENITIYRFPSHCPRCGKELSSNASVDLFDGQDPFDFNPGVKRCPHCETEIHAKEETYPLEEIMN